MTREEIEAALGKKMHEISKKTFGIHMPMAGDMVPVSQIPLAPARHI